MQSHTKGRSGIFKNFLKAISKPKKIQRDKMPTYQALMGCPEYAQSQKVNEVNLEMTCLEIQTGGNKNDALKLLLFKFSKPEKSEKHYDVEDFQDSDLDKSDYDGFRAETEEKSKEDFAFMYSDVTKQGE